MPIPATYGPYGLLPSGKHACTMQELEQAFVANAPFPAERRAIFEAFTLWVASVGTLFPGARCWVDGGFVTHKPWAAPKDIDAVFFVRDRDLNALDEAQKMTLASLLTHEGAGGVRVQPMGGKVDGFMGLRTDPDGTAWWRDFWGQVKGSDGNRVDNETKGYLEVIV